MDATSVLENSHTLLIQAVDDLPESEWEVPGVCGEWSVKDIVAHLASYERLLIDVLDTFLGQEITPFMRTFIDDMGAFNATMVESRKYLTAQQVLNEYQEAQVQTSSLLAQIPAEKIQQAGTVPWIGADRCLTDLINIVCSHTSEHCGQIKQFRGGPDVSVEV